MANLPKCCVSGVRLMSELCDKVEKAISTKDLIARNHPMLTDWGVRDEDVLIHSLGCSAWNSIGQELGYMAVCECPAPGAYSADIRSDSAWFSRASKKPEVLIEFERFDGTDRCVKKLDEKIRNLLDAADRWRQAPNLLVLSAWSQGVISAPNTSGFVDLFHRGFKTGIGAQVPAMRNVAVLFNRMIFQRSTDGTLTLAYLLNERLQ